MFSKFEGPALEADINEKYPRSYEIMKKRLESMRNISKTIKKVHHFSKDARKLSTTGGRALVRELRETSSSGILGDQLNSCHSFDKSEERRVWKLTQRGRASLAERLSNDRKGNLGLEERESEK